MPLSAGAKGTERKRPNLVYIHSDQHCYAVTGCYGDSVISTPNLDRLAARGVVFDNAYCPAPLCVPSRMSMMTGRHPHEVGVWTNEHTLDSSIPTFAHAMGAAGYQPVCIGRLHSIGPDQLLGFADRLVGDHCPNFSGGAQPDRGFLSGTQAPDRLSLERSGPGQSSYQVHDEDVTATAVHYLDQRGVQARAGLLTEPFNVTVGLMLPHQPFVARRADYDLYEGRVPMPRHPRPISEETHPHLLRWRAQTGIETVSDEAILRSRTAYWALVARMDAMIGQVLEALRENGLEENTLIVYSSDHGDQLGEHGLWWKQTFYEYSARVPMILSWPGVLPQGTRSDRVVSALDLNATMVDALGATPLPGSHGRSLLSLFGDDAQEWEDVVFSEYCTDDGCQHRMIRSGPWKLNYYHGQEPQLFNLEEDPAELCDRASDPACSDVRAELARRLLEGWDPEDVAERMRAKYDDLQVLQRWAASTHPQDRYRWPMVREMSYLD